MIYVFLADGFEEIEALTPVDILRRAGQTVMTVGVTGKTVMGAHKIPVCADVLIDDIDITVAKAVILPGGMPGTLNLQNDKRVIDAVNYVYENGKLVCAICAAPSVLGGMGLLNGKTAVCYPGFEEKLSGAVIGKNKVERDGNIITSRGPGTASEFGFKILKAVTENEKLCEEIKSGMLFD